MGITYKTTKDNVDWQQVTDVIKNAGLSQASKELQEKEFSNSQVVVFVYDDDKIVGVGRALSDGVSQGAIYNVALDDKYQGQGIGKAIVEKLIEQMPGQNIILYTHPQTVAMYEKFGFRRSKTAMEYFSIDEEHLKWLENEGFFLPKGFRFADEYGREDMQGPKWKK